MTAPPSAARSAALFEPLDLPRSGLALRNRLVMAPMPTFAAEPDGAASSVEARYYRRRAEGGVAAVVTAGCAVDPGGICFAGQWRCDDDRFQGSLAAVAEAIRASGARAVLQLCDDTPRLDRFTETDVAALLDAFRRGAALGARAGFDAVELHGGHRLLPQRFFSAAKNSRSWAWGGPTPRERMRFPLAAARAVRESVASCWYRLDPVEEGGISLDQTVELAAALTAAGVEVLDVSARRYAAPGERPPAARLQQTLGASCAVMAVGGVRSASEARRALADGCRLIGLGRVLLGEPDWANKTREGREDELRISAIDDDTLRAGATPEPVIEFLARGRDSE